MRKTVLKIGALVAATMIGGPAAAQTSWGFHGGASLPQGDFAKLANNGFQAGMLLGYGQWRPMAYRLEAALGQYKYELAPDDAKAQVLSAVGNAIFAPAAARGAYVTGGIGIYYMRALCMGCQAHTTKGGLNAGLGYRFGAVRAKPSVAIESRYHLIPGGSDPTTAGIASGTRFIPISVVVTFPTWKMNTLR
jgi:hypothetical protein